MSKSKIVIPLLVCTLAFSLAGCVREDDNIVDDASTSQTDISDDMAESENEQEMPSVASVSTPEVIAREEIAEQDLGENAESAYYEIVTAEDGTRSYRVIRSGDDEPIDLPASETVLYLSKSNEHYYEQVKYTYKLNGEDAETVQYAIHVPDPEVGTDDAVENTANTGTDTADSAAD